MWEHFFYSAECHLTSWEQLMVNGEKRVVDVSE